MDFSTKTIREIALEMPQTIRVFEDFKIDYCCGGRRPFAEACENAGVDPNALSDKLATALSGNQDDRPENLTASELIDYIIAKHHVFTVDEIGRLTALMYKVCDRHGEQHKELFQLREIFEEMADDMLLHMRKEEGMLFPYIKRLEGAAENNSVPMMPPFGTVRYPIQMMMQEHDTAAEQFREMRKVTASYTLPPEACPSFKGLYVGLQDLEKDLHQHVHLENNVLFPCAEGLEKRVFE
jgi:regulator of cell morphogenesis and NO signaling